jgi:hypothetical protein
VATVLFRVHQNISRSPKDKMKTLLPLTAVASLTIATGFHSIAADGINSLNAISGSSDSDVDISAISEAATDDAPEFFESHNDKKWHDEALNIGIANGIKNGYKGQAAYLYGDYFYTAFDALYKDQ